MFLLDALQELSAAEANIVQLGTTPCVTPCGLANIPWAAVTLEDLGCNGGESLYHIFKKPTELQ